MRAWDQTGCPSTWRHFGRTVGLVLFGAHLLLVGYLAYKSEFIPNCLGALICIAGGGYAFDGLATVLSNGSIPKITPFTFIGGLALALCLVIRDRHLSAGELAATRMPA
ncbi:DUF4386 family protein [Aeromicrobium sp.]|uniref:DUF4386 domain-containing protein n=1 Tax=Aeromicrobium sp. TaxID=1871063 RepID=UPI0019C357D2|nr:DUF4386 domain-containing protein [Aeromicrobium sp.]